MPRNLFDWIKLLTNICSLWGAVVIGQIAWKALTVHADIFDKVVTGVFLFLLFDFINSKIRM